MRIGDQEYRSIWIDDRTGRLQIIDQTELPHRFVIRTLTSIESACEAIKSMRIRGAPLIGATAAHALALALETDPTDHGLDRAAKQLLSTRPTAINLRWALRRMKEILIPHTLTERADRAKLEAIAICNEDVNCCEAIGNHGLGVLQELAANKKEGDPLQILTHCNAGWLAAVDWGTALAPIYKAAAAGIPVHVWVDETRPRNQGASLTAFELREQGIPHTVIVDNAGGHLMQMGHIDAVLVGSDRTTAAGDVCNKIGTYLKALAAREHQIPFYVALPTSTIDWEIEDGLTGIPIEERPASEVREILGTDAEGNLQRIQILSEASAVANPAFDVTPSRFVTALVTEHGVWQASPTALRELRSSLTELGTLKN